MEVDPIRGTRRGRSVGEVPVIGSLRAGLVIAWAAT
jgi:hypothetical protein